MREKIGIFDIISKYFADKISDEERNVLAEWLKNPNNRRQFKEMAKINYITSAEVPKEAHITKRSFTSTILRYAAILMFLISVGLYFLNIYNRTAASPNDFSIVVNDKVYYIKNINKNSIVKDEQDKEIAMVQGGKLRMLEGESGDILQVTVPYGKNLAMLLSDGSEVILNAGTKLSISRDFITGSSRRVHLEGEAYFKVAKDPNHPFYVETAKFTTRVLGTTFSISSYVDDRTAYVNLLEGSVKIIAKQNKTENILVPGQKILFSEKNPHPALEKIEPVKDLDWLNKKISFENNSTEEVLHKIERVYGYKIIFDPASIDNAYFSGTFKIDNLNQIINSLELLLNCKIEKREDALILISNNNN